MKLQLTNDGQPGSDASGLVPRDALVLIEFGANFRDGQLTGN
jgi:hypothetical protein